jgi:hypothetical protein
MSENPDFKEHTDGEVRLLEIADEFEKFLETKPQIRYNLHRFIKEIHEHFKFIQNNCGGI